MSCASAALGTVAGIGVCVEMHMRSAVLGVLLGSRAGLLFGGRARVKWLKILMAVVLAAVSILYFKRSL